MIEGFSLQPMVLIGPGDEQRLLQVLPGVVKFVFATVEHAQVEQQAVLVLVVASQAVVLHCGA